MLGCELSTAELIRMTIAESEKSVIVADRIAVVSRLHSVKRRQKNRGQLGLGRGTETHSPVNLSLTENGLNNRMLACRRAGRVKSPRLPERPNRAISPPSPPGEKETERHLCQ
ncbi:hypothetical protein J6590_052310 [Homalodisca vitripennis]|nr:hypothetical protein J6590_052310 [Homalodisca vitripennis]